MDDLADDWNVDAVGSPSVRCARRPDGNDQAGSRDSRSRLLREDHLHPNAWRVAVEHRLPQALVTVNPDLFAGYVVPMHGLDAVFDVSWPRSLRGLRSRPCARLHLTISGLADDRSSALVIDNRICIASEFLSGWDGGPTQRD